MKDIVKSKHKIKVLSIVQSRTFRHTNKKGIHFPEDDGLTNKVAKEAHFIQGS